MTATHLAASRSTPDATSPQVPQSNPERGASLWSAPALQEVGERATRTPPDVPLWTVIDLPDPARRLLDPLLQIDHVIVDVPDAVPRTWLVGVPVRLRSFRAVVHVIVVRNVDVPDAGPRTWGRRALSRAVCRGLHAAAHVRVARVIEFDAGRHGQG